MVWPFWWWCNRVVVADKNKQRIFAFLGTKPYGFKTIRKGVLWIKQMEVVWSREQEREGELCWTKKWQNKAENFLAKPLDIVPLLLLKKGLIFKVFWSGNFLILCLFLGAWNWLGYLEMRQKWCWLLELLLLTGVIKDVIYILY